MYCMYMCICRSVVVFFEAGPQISRRPTRNLEKKRCGLSVVTACHILSLFLHFLLAANT